MQPTIDAQKLSVSHSSALVPAVPPALPDIYRVPRRRAPAWLSAAFGFAAAGGLFYGAQAFAPEDWRPSRFVGDYNNEIQEARTAGELEARIRYDAQLRGIELQYQGQLQEIQTAAVQWQEHCRSGLQNFNNLYQAVYQRANTFANGLVQLQNQYAAARYQTVQGTLQGEAAAANLATMFGYIGGFFDPELQRRSMEYAENARMQALNRLDRAAQSGIRVTVDGWDDGLPDPAALAPPVRCEVPAFAAALRQRAIAVPPVVAPPKVSS